MIKDYEIHEKTLEVKIMSNNKPKGGFINRLNWLVRQRRTWAAVCSVLAMFSLNMGYTEVATGLGGIAAVLAGRSLQAPR